MKKAFSRKWMASLATAILFVVGGLCVTSPLHASDSAMGSPGVELTPSGRCLKTFAELYSKSDFVESRLISPLLRGHCGVNVDPVYYGEVFTNTRGGKSTNDATQYQGLIELPVTFELEKMGAPLPGTFFLLAQNTHGRGLTEGFVGDTQVVSNIDSFDNL